jgi:hypothetical protein
VYRCLGHPPRVARRPVLARFCFAAPAARAEGSGSSHGTIAPRHPGGGPPLACVGLRELRRHILERSPASSCRGFHRKPVVEFHFYRAGRHKLRRQRLRQPHERFFRRRSNSARGALSHSASLALAIQAANNPALPRTAFERTDSNSASDDPFGEPHHRHIAYDPANKHVFVANRAMNRVEVFSSSSQSPIAQISVPAASSADLSADGSTVWIGTALERIVAIDTSSLRVSKRYSLAGLSPIPGTIFSRPIEVLSLSSGKCMLRLHQPVSSEALLAL